MKLFTPVRTKARRRWCSEKRFYRGVAMAYWFRATLAENPSFVPSNHIGQFTTASKSSSWKADTFFCLPFMCTYLRIEVHAAHLKKKRLSKENLMAYRGMNEVRKAQKRMGVPMD